MCDLQSEGPSSFTHEMTLTNDSCVHVQIAGKGDSATILQQDVPACGGVQGPSYLQVVDAFLLPFV